MVKLWTIQDDQNNVTVVVPSDDHKLYATFCQDSTKVYIGDLTIPGQPKIVLNYTGPVKSISWRPGTVQLAIAGQTQEGQSFLFLYDCGQQSQDDLSHLPDYSIADLAFSASGDTLFFVQNDIQNQTVFKLNAYDIQAKSLAIPLESSQREYRGVSAKGQFVSVWDDEFVYVLRRDGDTYDYQGHYASKLQSNGLSPDGGELVTLSPDSTQIVLYKICLNGTVYDSKTDTCIQCQPSCQECFLSASSCSSCPASGYLTPGFTCLECRQTLKGCKSCTNGTYCTDCDADQHWVLDYISHTCICSSRYVKINNQCLRCPSHCLRCSSPDSCLVCDQSQHWTRQQSSCVCQSGYTETQQTCMSCSFAISHCLTCSSPFICTSCETGFEWDEHECREPTNYVMIFGIVAGVALVLAAGGFFLMRWMRRRKDNRSLLEAEGVDAVQ